MGVKLRRGVSIYRASSVVFELRSDKLAGGLGLVVAADPRLGVPLDLRKGGRYGCAVRFPDLFVTDVSAILKFPGFAA